MKGKEIASELGDVIEENGNREKTLGEYHPSTISGCPLKAFLKWITDNETLVNRWLFQGSAVHYYLQEKPGMLTEALHRAGYHPLNTDYEVHTEYHINDDVLITGTCDVLTHGDENDAIIDLKYSSVPPDSNHGRLWKYASQVNTYANMFKADEWGLLMINSKSDNIPNDIAMIDGEADEENFEIVTSKAVSIDSALRNFDYGEGERLEASQLESDMMDLWEEVFEYLDRQNCPSHEEECRYCDFKECCPVKQGEFGGLNAL